MKSMKIFLLWYSLAIQRALSDGIETNHETHSQINEEARGRRDVIEEEKYYNIRTSDMTKKDINLPTPWLPGSLPPEEDATTKISINNNEVHEALPLYQTTEIITDKPTGRGARASNENWVKLPYPDREELRKNDRSEILTPPQPSGELIKSRMPRINFITQNKALETSESRNDKEVIHRPTRTEDVRTEFVRPGENDRTDEFKPVYARQAVYYPEESRRVYYDDRYYPPEDLYRQDPYLDGYDRRKYYPVYGPRTDRYDDAYIPRKPKRIIYYAHLPEVVRTPPSVDLRYRYTPDPYRRFDDDYYTRGGRYDYRFRNRYPYAPLRKDERNYRDLAGAGTTNADKKIEEKVTPTPVLPQKEVIPKTDANHNRINSKQYRDSSDASYKDALTHKSFQDVVRPDEGYFRFEEPLFQAAIDNPYTKRY